MGYKSKFKGSTVDDRVSLIPSLIGKIRSLTYQSLLDLREESKLKPGQLYRITDYVTTTSQTNTQSAGHQFDVIVLALTNDTLAERAWACHHEGDTYFQNSHLEAWQIWYCLDNDTERFAWAVPSSNGGKGVIYRMIDEWNNDCPYDFKNIKFNRFTGLKSCYTFYAYADGDYVDASNRIRDAKIEGSMRSSITCFLPRIFISCDALIDYNIANIPRISIRDSVEIEVTLGASEVNSIWIAPKIINISNCSRFMVSVSDINGIDMEGINIESGTTVGNFSFGFSTQNGILYVRESLGSDMPVTFRLAQLV